MNTHVHIHMNTLHRKWKEVREEREGKRKAASLFLALFLDLLVSEVDIIVHCYYLRMSFLSLLSPVDQPGRGKQGH